LLQLASPLLLVYLGTLQTSRAVQEHSSSASELLHAASNGKQRGSKGHQTHRLPIKVAAALTTVLELMHGW
jgi:hypothetical protein